MILETLPRGVKALAAHTETVSEMDSDLDCRGRSKDALKRKFTAAKLAWCSALSID
jgi:hypothetical protein